MKKYIITVVLMSSAFIANAQQLQTSSFADLNGIVYNPSLAGVQQDEEIKSTVGATYRTQWSGISGSPQTATIFGSFNLPKQKIGIGGYLYNDQTGPTRRTGVTLSLAKHIVFNNGAVFSLGIENRLQQYSIDRSKLEGSLGNDPALGTTDNRFKYDAGFGISYTDKKWQLGASVSQLIQSKLDFYSGNLAVTEEARLYRHYYFTAKYNWDVDGTTTISPNAMIIYLPNAPTEVVGGVRVEHNKTVWWGIGYRYEQNFMLSAGFNIQKKFSISYAYDIYSKPVSNFDGGHSAHEFMLRYNIVK